MPNVEFKYIKDCLAMNDLAEEQFGLIKQANPISDMLGGLTSSILNAGKEQIDNHGIAGGLANLMLPAILFKISPLFGTLYQVSSIMFNFSLTDVYGKFMQILSPKIRSGEKITFEEIDQATNRIANETLSQTELQKVQSLQLNGLKKFARPPYKDADGFLAGLKNFINSDQTNQTKHQNNWLLPNKGPNGKTGVIERIFGNLLKAPFGRSKAIWFLVGIIGWAIKTLLVGAGLAAVGNYLKNKINNTQSEKPPTNSNIINGYDLTTNHQEKRFANNNQEDWEIKLINNSIEDTLLVWIKDIYPNLQLPEEKITSSSQFLRIQEIMSHNFDPETLPNFRMPKGFYSRKQVVDLIVMPLVNSK